MPRLALTDRFVSGAKSPGAPQTDFFDEKTPGLALRVSSGGRKTWSFIYTSPTNGKRARATLGSYPQTSLAAARARALEAGGHLEDGRDPRDVFADRHAGGMTVAALVSSYLEKHVRPRLRTAQAIERRFARNVLPVIGGIRLGDLHRRDANRVVDPVLARGKQVEAARVFEDMRALMRWAVARGDIDRSPLDGMRKPAVSTPRERVLSDEEIRTLWQSLPMVLTKSKAAQRIIRLCLLTAQRVGEIAGMAPGEIDFAARVWTVPAARSKNKHAHQVPLTPLVLEIVRDAMADAGEGALYLFPDAGGDGPLPPHAVAKTITRAQERFGIPHWTAHDLRRTAVTGMARLGVAPIVLGHVINHRSVTKAGVTLSVYAHYDYAAEKRAALELWASRLAAIISGGAADIVPMRGAR